TMDTYDGRGWLSRGTGAILIDENRQEFVLPDSVAETPGQGTYWQTYYLLSDQPNAVFTGYSPGKLYLPQLNEVFLEKGSLYRALSPVPNLKPASLRRDVVVSEDVDNLVLPAISQRTAALAESIVAGATNDYDRAVRLERFLMANYPYDLSVGGLPEGRDAADYFLFELQRGYCSHFATAMAVMARHVGLPARVAAGYLPGYIDPMTGAHVVRAGDAHAWVEINFRRHGWVAFDPTPRADVNLGFASKRSPVYFGLDEFTKLNVTGLFNPFARGFSFKSFNLPLWAWAIFLGILSLAIIMWFNKRSMKLEVKRGGEKYSHLDGENRKSMVRTYSVMEKILGKKGLPVRQAHQSPAEYLKMITTRILNGEKLIEWVTVQTTRAAY
ncbi:MAG: transglutaminase-like domain-containing protein, partial [Dehalococcoidia bacterium]|nr:transglutaminase-like domain-containing protein [Dehalococcoidia bacterium]